MKLKEFLDNPAGKGDSSLNRAVLKQTLDSKYDRLIRDKSDKIRVNVYHILMTNNYIIHLILPSETERNNTYDVVLLFEQEHNVSLSTSLLSTHDVKFFANSPSFAYTFAKVYYDEGLFIESLKHKFPDEIFTQLPEVRNRYNIVNYDKYLYFGCKYVYEAKLLNVASIGLRSVGYNPAIFNNKIRTLDKIMIEYRKAKRELEEKRGDSRHTKINDAKSKHSNYTGPKPITIIQKSNHVKSKKTKIKGRRK